MLLHPGVAHLHEQGPVGLDEVDVPVPVERVGIPEEALESEYQRIYTGADKQVAHAMSFAKQKAASSALELEKLTSERSPVRYC